MSPSRPAAEERDQFAKEVGGNIMKSNFKVAASSLQPEIRFGAEEPSSERMSQSDECKIIDTSLCFHANLVSV